MGCRDQPATCRGRIAELLGLQPNPRSPGDYEGRCPGCGHGGFALSAGRKYPHIWCCNCPRCPCRGREGAGVVRLAILRKDIDRRCLGDYDGTRQHEPDSAAILAIRDILALPRMRPADIRIILAEAAGQKIPDDYTSFVRFAKGLGIGKTQAQEAATRWCRPPDWSPPNGGGVVDT